MSRTDGAPPTPSFPKSNQEFLEWIFGRDQWKRVHVTGFAGSPETPPDGAWGGGPAGTRRFDERINNYFTVSLFRGNRRVAQSLERWVLLGIDDVGPKVRAIDVLKLLGEPSFRIETSPGNEQWGYRLAGEPITDPIWANEFIKALIRKLVGDDGKDPGMRDVTRYLRLPFGRNLKAACGPGGFAVRMVHRAMDPDHGLHITETICASMGVSPVSPGGSAASPPGAKPLPAGWDPVLAEQDPLFQAISRLGLVLGGPRKSDMGWAFDIVCPWSHEHTNRAFTGTAYVPGRGNFKCHHGHCIDRHPGDVRVRLDEMLREESFGLVGLVHLEFDDVDPAALSELATPPRRQETKAEQAFFARFVYLRPKDGFWDTKRQVLVKDRDVDTAWTSALEDCLPTTGRGARRRSMPPSAWFLRDPRGVRVEGLIRWPDHPAVVEHERQLHANLWRPLTRPLVAARVDDAAIKPWLDLFWHVIGSETLEAFELGHTVLDWLAMVLASSVKGGWQVVVIGKQGIGKDMILAPLAHTLGRRYQLLRGDDMNSGFSAWLDRRLVQLSEIRQTTRGALTPHDQMARLKGAFDPGKEWLTINPKYAPQYESRNIVMGWLTSNEDSPIRLEEGDRRFLVLDRRDVERQAESVYARLGQWYADEDGFALVAEWLFRRWSAMSPACRDRLTGHAPMTEAKADIISENEDPVDVWLRGCIESQHPDPRALPDVVSVDFVAERVLQAQREGWFGGVRASVNPVAIGRQLAKMGATKLNNGHPINVQGHRCRAWAVRNIPLYFQLAAAEIAKVCNVIVTTQQNERSH